MPNEFCIIFIKIVGYKDLTYVNYRYTFIFRMGSQAAKIMQRNDKGFTNDNINENSNVNISKQMLIVLNVTAIQN